MFVGDREPVKSAFAVNWPTSFALSFLRTAWVGPTRSVVNHD